MKTKILIIGANGMAGQLVYLYFKNLKNYKIFTLARTEKFHKIDFKIDVKNKHEVADVLNTIKPNFIINLVGVLNTNAEQNPDNAIWINSFFPHFLAKIATNIGSKLIHISTDCVFNGKKGSYKENDVKDGYGVYAQSKSLGEINYSNHITLRTSIIGPDLNKNGIGLFNWILKNKNDIVGYSNVFWGGITTLELSKAIDFVINNNPRTNLVHVTNNLKISKFDLIKVIDRVFNLNLNLISETETKYDKSLLNTSEIFNYKTPSYDKMINELNGRKNKIKAEINENQKNPEKIATTKGQNIQNVENTKKRSEELNEELTKAETKYNLINQNLKEIQEKFSLLRENKARSEATIEGIEKRKKDLVYSIKNDLKLDNENNLLSISNLNTLTPEKWVQLYSDYLYNYTITRVSSDEMAKDLVQETFFAGLKSMKNFQGRASERTWLVSILKRKIIDHYRKINSKKGKAEVRMNFYKDGDNAGEWIEERVPNSWSDGADSDIENDELKEVLEKCIEKLPEKYKMVLEFTNMLIA